MVPFLECIPIAALLEFLFKRFFSDDGKSKKEKMEFESTLNRAKSILTDMETLINGKKPIPVGKEVLEMLERKLKKGNELVLEIETLDYVDKKRYNKELQDWMQSLKDSLTSSVVGFLISLATDVKQIKQLLLINLLEGEARNIAFEKFLRSEGLEQLLPEREPVRTHHTKDAKKLTRNAMQRLTIVDSKTQEKELRSAKSRDAKKLKQKISQRLEEKYNKKNHELTDAVKRTRTRTQESAENRKLESKAPMALLTEKNHKKKELKSRSAARMDSYQSKSKSRALKPKKNLRRVRLAVWVRDEFSKREVLSTKTIERPNKEKDSVIVKATKDLDVDDLIKHLKKKFCNQRNVIVKSDKPWDET